MLSCLAYPECRAVQFFPPYVLHAVPDSSTCSRVSGLDLYLRTFMYALEGGGGGGGGEGDESSHVAELVV